MNTRAIRIGGVPEHFNLPVRLAQEAGAFRQRGVEVTWTTFPGGTGQMTRALRDNEVDICIVLTEGIIADLIHGNPSKIISEYVITPLTWGIHTGARSSLRHHQEIYDKQYAISRWGSGSHLMAVIDANSQGKKLREEQFHLVGNLEGALASLGNLETDVFYWEKYTTAPYVDSGALRRIGVYITPWPCFVMAATAEVLKEQPENVIRVLRTIHDAVDNFMRNPDAVPIVSNRYQIKMEDTERWYHSTEWAIHGWVSDKMIASVIYHLGMAGIIEPDADIPELIWKR